MLKDQVTVKFKAGNGGGGAVKFAGGTNKYPTGGDGGKGGDVYLEGTTDLYDLGFINRDDTYKAEHGIIGGDNKARGAHGKDLIFRVPLVTEVQDLEGNVICSVRKKGEKILLLNGGKGGFGNYYFRKGQAETYKLATPGKDGEETHVRLVLKLVADVVFIGLPNAGKSSMLNALTNANVKVGNYAFTTLSPHLGSLPGITFMDLPGLIEGTAQGKGLGSGFIKHTENASLIAHFISLESPDLLNDYKVIRKELESISSILSDKKEIIVATKSDEFTDEEIQIKIAGLKKLKKQILICSIIDDEALHTVVETFKSEVKTIKSQDE